MSDAAVPAVDFTAATSLALVLDFDLPHPQLFGAPPATAQPLRIGSFEGAVARGASCNCQRLTLVPHCHGTHTESASHLTLEACALHELLPLAPVPALLLTVDPVPASDSDEDSVPAPRPGDQLVTRAALMKAWHLHPDQPVQALLLRTGTHWQDEAPPYLSRQFVAELVARGVQHLVTDLPSVDRLQDEGRLTAHRLFFGLPPDSTHLPDATRPAASITELACFPGSLHDGYCALQLQVPAWSGDAVPSRPLHLPLRPA